MNNRSNNQPSHWRYRKWWHIWTITLIFILFFSYGDIVTLRPTEHVYAAPVSPAATTVYGQAGNFTTNTANNGGLSATSLSSPRRVTPDSLGGLYVSDFTNNRVLYYPSGSTTATRVYGQNGSFTTGTANNGGISANSLNQPRGVAVDSSNNLYIADSGNNRVLYYPSGSTTATRVYGQNGSFTTGTVNAPVGVISAGSLSQPIGVTVDGSGGVYVADTNNHRVLYFVSGSTTATRVYGQLLSFLTGIAGTSATAMSSPVEVILDSSNNLYVAEIGNNRVTYYVSASTTATRVYGQNGSFTTGTANNGGISANSLNQPYGLRLDANNNLYIADTVNNRALYYPSGTTTATRVYGQGGSFTTGTANNGGISARSLSTPVGLTIGTNNNLYIADSSNNRVVRFQTTLSVTTQPPTTVGVNAAFTTVISLVDVGSSGIFDDFTGNITVAIKAGTGTAGATLSGTTSANAVSGTATFSNLAINTPGTGYVLTASNTLAGSVDTNSFIVSGSLLFTPLTSPTFSYTLTGSATTVSSQYTFKVNDTTASGVGWNVTITSTQFVTVGGKTLPTTAAKITSVTSACTSGQTCVVPTNTVTGYPLTVPAATTAPTAIPFLRAAANTGTGDTTITVNFTLSIPQGTAAGTYTSLFTVTLVKGQ